MAKDVPKTDTKQPSFKKRVKKFGKIIYRVIKSHAGLTLLLVLYTALGGAIFSQLEGPHETQESIAMNTTREQFLIDMRKALGRRNWSDETRNLLDEFEDRMKYYFSHARDVENGEIKRTWTFVGALIYSVTIYTTIGYGHIAPVTDEGKAATVIYAIIGIPLCLLVMADLGRLMTKGIKALFALIKRFYYTGQFSKVRKTKALVFLEKKLDMKSQSDVKDADSPEAEGKTLLYGYEIDEEFNLPVPVALIIVGIYLFGCAAIYTRWEDWTYGEALYFLFISMSTIGFGDIVPEHQRFFLASSLLVLFGLSLVSMTITVLVDFIADLYTKAKEKVQKRVTAIGDKIGIDLNAMDKDDEDEKTPEPEKKPLPEEEKEKTEEEENVDSKKETQDETESKEADDTKGEEEKADSKETEDETTERASTPTEEKSKSKIPQRKT